MGAFEYRQAEEIRERFAEHRVEYLFLGKSGAILLGFPDTTQDADLFVKKSESNGRAIVAALRELGFALNDSQAEEIVRGKDFVQLKNGPFDLDLIFAPTGSSRSTTPGNAMWTWRAFLSVTWMTLSPARKRRIARRTASRCRGCAASANFGKNDALDQTLRGPIFHTGFSQLSGKLCRLFR